MSAVIGGNKMNREFDLTIAMIRLLGDFYGFNGPISRARVETYSRKKERPCEITSKL